MLTPPLILSGVLRHVARPVTLSDVRLCSRGRVLAAQAAAPAGVTVTVGALTVLDRLLPSLCFTTRVTLLIVLPVGIWFDAGTGNVVAGENWLTVMVFAVELLSDTVADEL